MRITLTEYEYRKEIVHVTYLHGATTDTYAMAEENFYFDYNDDPARPQQAITLEFPYGERPHVGDIYAFDTWIQEQNFPPGVRVTPRLLVLLIDTYNDGRTVQDLAFCGRDHTLCGCPENNYCQEQHI